LTSEYVMEKISDKIYLIAEDLNLERKWQRSKRNYWWKRFTNG
jgi:hypothetical protein